MVGIRFTYIAKNAGQHFLGLLLNAVNIEDFIWQIDESDIYILPCKSNDYLFNSAIIDGYSFKNTINQKRYFVVSCSLKAYPSLGSVKDLSTYKDYVNSDCQMIVVITDNQFVTILAKKDIMIKNIETKIKNYGISLSVEYITKLDDDRYLTNI